MPHESAPDSDAIRLRHLLDVAASEERNLVATGDRLFREGTPHDIARAAAQDPVIAERIEAFVARFSRLQDMLGDKILPLTLRMAGEDVLPMIGNLDRAERYGWLDSADGWLRVRKLRNRMVHEYVNDSADLAAALGDIHAAVPSLSRCLTNLGRFAESRLL